ncbi:hypothetical protein YC2023_089073 [Brassica napus]
MISQIIEDQEMLVFHRVALETGLADEGQRAPVNTRRPVGSLAIYQTDWLKSPRLDSELRLPGCKTGYSAEFLNKGLFLIISAFPIKLGFIFSSRSGFISSINFCVFSQFMGSSMHPPRRGSFPTRATTEQGAINFMKNTPQADHVDGGGASYTDLEG